MKTEGDSVSEELLQHTITLEKASLSLIETVSKMVDRMDRILSLFEEAAKNIEKTEVKEPLAQQLEALLEQNKVIARGLILLEKYIREKTPIGFTSMPPLERPLPRTL